MKKLAAVGLISFLMISIAIPHSMLDVRTEEGSELSEDTEDYHLHHGIPQVGKRIVSEDENGGSWSDNFENGGKVADSENISISDGRAILAENEIEADEHTVGFWRFDEGSGGTAHDSSGNGNDGTVIGANWTESEIGTILAFDGVNDHVDCGNNGTLDITGEITLEAWMKPGTSIWENWSYKKMITIDHTKVHGTLMDFPLLVSTTDPDLKDTAHDGAVQLDGDDLLFTTVNGTKLDHEIESYRGETGELVAWVRLPVISDAADTELHLYYGNNRSTGEDDPEEVWDGDYRMVQHLEETDGSHLDSTSNDNDGTVHNQVYQDADGKIDGADQFDGSNDYVSVSDDISLDISGKELTIETWIKPYNIDSHSYIISRGNDLYAMLMSWRTIEFYYMKNGHKWESVETGYGTINNNDQWYNIVITMEDDLIKIYINGEVSKVANKGGRLQSGQSDLRIGSKTNNNYFFTGIIDEVRISATTRSENWIRTAYNNQIDPPGFLAFGDQLGKGIRKIGCYGIHANDTHATATVNQRVLNTTISDDWNHIVQTYNGSVQKLYVNGDLAASQSFSEVIINNSNNLYMGNFYNGMMDEVHLYDRTLSGTEIMEHFDRCPGRGTLRSEIIDIPEAMVWNSFSYNRSVPEKTALNISLHDGESGEVLFSEDSDTTAGHRSLSFIDPLKTTSVYLVAVFLSDGIARPVLHNWSMSWIPPEAPKLIRDVGTITIWEENPEDNILDLSNYFHDPYSDFQTPRYSIEHVSETAHINLSLDDAELDVTYLATNWTGVVSTALGCTNMFGMTNVTPYFDIIVGNVNDPPLVKLFSPNNGATLGENAAALSWKGYDVDNKVSDLSFDLYLGTSDPPPVYARNIIGQNLTVKDLDDNTTYYWTVLPSDGEFAGHCSSGIWDFTISTVAPVPEVTLLSPLHDAVINTTDTTLYWESTNPSGNDLTYHIYMGNDRENIKEINTTDEEEYRLTELLNDSTYHWSVIPHSGDVQGECLSGIWKFSVNVSHESDVLLDFVRDVDPLEIFQGMNETFNITIINNGGENVQVRLSGSGALAGNVELPRDITAFVGLNRISIIISIPGDLEPGSYDLTLRMSFNSGSKDLILPVSVKKFKESDDDGDSGSASGQKGRIGRTWLWILTGAIVLLIIIVGLVYFLKGRKEEREPVQEEFGRAPKTVNIRAKERMGPSGSCKATGYKIIDPKLSSEVITREQIRAKMSREEQRRRVGGKKPVPARVPVKESRVRGPDPKAATAQNAAPVVVSDKSQKIISPKGTDLVIRTLPVATKEIRKIKRLPESKTAASVSAAVPETSKEPEGGKSKVEEMNDLFDELKNGLPGMLGEDANIFLENGDMLNILSELDNLRKKAVESEEGEPGVEDEEPAGEERGEPASELYEAPATGVHEAPVSEEYEAPASEEYEAPDESTASIDEGIVLEEQQDLGHEDEKIEIGWDDEEKETGEENTDLEEKTEDVPERVDESESGEAIEDENGKALAKIPIRRVAISKETGEELNKCDSCGKYYDHTWDACPNCSGGSQSASGKTGLDPTDKEAEDESGESPRRYPEEEIFDDDLNLEDIIEGM